MDTQRFERQFRADQAGFETSLAELARVPMGDERARSSPSHGPATLSPQPAGWWPTPPGLPCVNRPSWQEMPLSVTTAIEPMLWKRSHERPDFVCVLSRYRADGGIATTVRCSRSSLKRVGPSL